MFANWIASRPMSVHRSTASAVASADGRLWQLHRDPGSAVEPDPMPKAASRDKKRSHYGKRPNASRRHYDVDRITGTLRQLYDRVAAEPLPRRLISLLNRLKVHH